MGASTLSAAQTAAALADPGRSVLGVWSVASHLGLGVYDIQGHEVMHGSEPFGDNTMFLYDFEIDLLSRGVADAPDTWDQFAQRMAAWDPSLIVSGTALRDAVISFYQSHPDDYSGQLLRAMNLDLRGAGGLTSFDEWLVIVDDLVLHNQQVGVLTSSGTRAASHEGITLLAAHRAQLFAAAIPTYTLIELSHGIALAGVFVTTIEPRGPVDLNMGSTAPGDGELFLISGSFTKPRFGQFDVPKKGPLKSYACVFEIPYGPLGNARTGVVEFFLSKYGDFRPTVVGSAEIGNTDPSGQNHLWYQAGEDPGHGKGNREVQRGELSAVVGSWPPRGFTCSRNDKFVGVRTLLHGPDVQVNVHYHLPSYKVSIEADVACKGGAGKLTISGKLVVDKSNPSLLHGTARFTATGTNGGTTSLEGKFLGSTFAYVEFWTGDIGIFAHTALAGGVGPFSMDAAGGQDGPTPIECGTITASAIPSP